MARVLRAFAWIVVYACVGTVLSEIALAAYLAHAWKLDGERLAKAMAVAQGVEPASVPGSPNQESAPVEQPSFDQVLERRALAVRSLEIREEALKSGIEQLRFEQRKLAEEKKQYRQLKDSFESELASLQKGALATGREEVRRTLESIRPKQAKEQLLEMLQKNELDEVVALLSGMPDAKRAKIVGEFKTQTEAEKLAEILRRVREATAVSAVTENAQKQLTQPKPAGP